MTKAAYEASKNVYDQKISKNDALNNLENDYGMNRGSASDYVVNFKKMIDGNKYTRTNNAEATDYFFTKILADYGVDRLKKAIESTKQYVKYYAKCFDSRLVFL